MKVLLATDGSEHSEGAAKFLTRFRFSSNDEILVLHVVSDIPYDDDAHAQLRHVIKRVAPKILNAGLKALRPLQARIDTMEEEGAPDATIIRVATDMAADMIVMGARGLKGIQSFFLGSVTRSVVINSPVPVLATKPAYWETSGTMEILFATDGSPSAQSTAKLLASLPFPADSELVIMNVAWSAASEIPERYAMEIDDRVKEDVARAKTIESEESRKIVEAARTCLEGRFSRITDVSKSGDPSLEIFSVAETVKADLIAMGSRGIKGLKGMLGSVSRRVLGHSPCPVLIGKAAEHI